MLRSRWENICREYVIDFDMGATARRCNMATIGQVLKRPEVAARIKELVAAKQARQDRKADEVIAEYEKIAFTPVAKKVMTKDKLHALDSLGKVHGIFEKDNEQSAVMVAPTIIVFSGKK